MSIFGFWKRNRKYDVDPLDVMTDSPKAEKLDEDECEAIFEVEFPLIAASPSKNAQLRVGRLMRDVVFCSPDHPREILMHGDISGELDDVKFISEQMFYIARDGRAFFYDIDELEPHEMLQFNAGHPVREGADFQILSLDWNAADKTFVALYILGTGLEDIAIDPYYRIAAFDETGKMLEDAGTGLLYELRGRRVIRPHIRLQNRVAHIESKELFSRYEYSFLTHKLTEYAKDE